MPRALFRSTLLLTFVLLANLIAPIAAPVAAHDATPAASPTQEDVYRDPGDRYEVPIPTGWTATVEDDVLDIAAPEGDYHVYVVVVPEPDMAAAIASSWELVDPGTAPVLVNEQEIPAPPGYDGLLVQVFTAGDGTDSYEALAYLVGDSSYVLLLRGDIDVAVRRASQVQIIGSGFDVLSVERESLLGIRPRRFTPAMLDELTAEIETALVSHDVPGAAVAIIQDGEIVYRHGFGVRELGQSDPVTPETLMMVGSITKSMTTMMMATVVDDGLMAWDTPAAGILPSFAVADPDLSATITMRQLVCACTGVPRRDLQYIFNASEMEPADTIASLAGFPFFTPIGEAFQYSNQMVAAGGYITTLAAGGSLPTLADDYVAEMNQRVFGPIGMEHTTLVMAEAEASLNHASSHAYAVDGSYDVLPLSAEALLAPVTPSAMVWSNVDDLGRYLLTQMAGGVTPEGERVVSLANLSETWQPQVPISAGESYGLGWNISTFRGQPMIQHAGNMVGFTADLAFLPESDLGIVILTNASVANLFTDEVRARAFELAFDIDLGADDYFAFALEQRAEQFARSETTIGAAPDAGTVAPFLGDYVSPVFGAVRLTYEDGRMVFDAGEFQGEVRPLQGEAAAVAGYVLIDGPVVGLLLNLRLDGETPVLETVDQITYEVNIFTAIQPATPIATPEAAATPVASPVP